MPPLKPNWHFGSPAIPTTVVALSLVALSIPVVASAVLAGVPVRFEALVWLIALAPAFLLAYYRGWAGVALGLAFGVAVFGLGQAYLIVSGHRLPDWPLVLGITAAFVGISLLLGGVAERLHTERERAERLALLDALTDIPNRRFVDLMLQKEFAAARRGRSVFVVAFDLDGLKAINDRHGHAVGDRSLQAFASVLSANTRAMDLSGRIGGDEFVSILSSSSPDGAGVFIQRIQDAAREAGGVQGAISVSAGVATFSPEMTEPGHLLEAADRALYQAKLDGPGGVALALAPADPPSALHLHPGTDVLPTPRRAETH